jgi:hypothetical protein
MKGVCPSILIYSIQVIHVGSLSFLFLFLQWCWLKNGCACTSVWSCTAFAELDWLDHLYTTWKLSQKALSVRKPLALIRSGQYSLPMYDYVVNLLHNVEVILCHTYFHSILNPLRKYQLILIHRDFNTTLDCPHVLWSPDCTWQVHLCIYGSQGVILVTCHFYGFSKFGTVSIKKSKSGEVGKNSKVLRSGKGSKKLKPFSESQNSWVG